MKDKGDRAEREALAYVKEHWSHLVRSNPMRMLGAGRRDDIGDLAVIDDVVIQVKAASPQTVVRQLRLAAAGAAAQRENADVAWGVGLVKHPRARYGSVRWVVATYQWPGHVEALECGSSSVTALAHARNELAGDRETRVAVVKGRGMPAMWISPIEAWMAAFERVGVRPGASTRP